MIIQFEIKANEEKTDEQGNANSPTLKKEGIKQEKGVVKKEVTAKTEKDHREAQRAKEAKIAESEIVKDLKFQLKLALMQIRFSFHSIKMFCRKAVNEQKEMKLLLDMYKGVPKEQRDKVQLMASEKKLRNELEDLRQQLKKIQVTIANESNSFCAVLTFSL